jgi:NADH:ubiquinone oxidoreductase subunit 5 (subunit L)/multisubunit Na+/H+ antiporter MnhA subunit
MFDSLAVSMFILVVPVSFLVQTYSVYYMKEDAHFIRFMAYISLFTFFMLILVTADNFIVLFLGWEGVGLCSYLLISFWFTRVQANKAALKALIMNRVGDCALLFGILVLFYYFRSVDFNTVFLLAHFFAECTFTVIVNNGLFQFQQDAHVISFICFFLFVGCCAKSAQIGLHT